MKKFLLGLMLLLAVGSSSEILSGWCGECSPPLNVCVVGICVDGQCMCD